MKKWFIAEEHRSHDFTPSDYLMMYRIINHSGFQEKWGHTNTYIQYHCLKFRWLQKFFPQKKDLKLFYKLIYKLSTQKVIHPSGKHSYSPRQRRTTV